MQPKVVEIQSSLTHLFKASAQEPLRMSPLVACAIAQNWEAGRLILDKGLFLPHHQVIVQRYFLIKSCLNNQSIWTPIG